MSPASSVPRTSTQRCSPPPQELWKSRIDDDRLKAAYDVGIRLDPKPAESSDPGIPAGSDHSPGDIPVPAEDLNLNSPDTPEDPEGASLEPASGRGSADHDYCSLAEPAASKHLNVLAERLYSIGNKSRCAATADESQEAAMSKLLDYVECWVEGRVDEERLAEAVMVLLQSHFHGYSVYTSPLLQAVAGWLGRRFHQANSSVSHQVEAFKLRNIEHIKDLPPAEDLATELFPEAMRSLLIHWMGLSEEAATWKRLSEYPIVLLILEFANHNLITGVAHVLYSSLICR